MEIEIDIFMRSNDPVYKCCPEEGVNNPGKVIMLLWLCHQEYKKSGKDYFTASDWGYNIFPMGVPTEEDQCDWWDSQKSAGEPLGNMVNNPEYWS